MAFSSVAPNPAYCSDIQTLPELRPRAAGLTDSDEEDAGGAHNQQQPQQRQPDPPPASGGRLKRRHQDALEEQPPETSHDPADQVQLEEDLGELEEDLGEGAPQQERTQQDDTELWEADEADASRAKRARNVLLDESDDEA